MANILVIDDDKPFLMLIAMALRQHGHTVLEASDGDAGVRLAETHLPDLIICDIQMPNMDGYEFLKALRQRGFTKHTPVLMLSANGERSEDRVKCYQYGAQDFLPKPFSPVELKEVIKKNIYPIHYAVKW